ncbi:SNF2 family N-terminal domain-containing protein [Chytriomyces cf. hyalinus JEL632]|nr:SNF2 family N-terminal domain-containing protein [Chytriomyces cf. hyalinus JEL632]
MEPSKELESEENVLSTLLAGATDQATLEKSLERKLLEDLKRRDNENDEKRIKRTNAKIRLAQTDLEALLDQLHKPNIKISTKQSVLEKITAAEETIDSLRKELADIDDRIHGRDAAAGPSSESRLRSNGAETHAQEMTREMLIRTGKITPFDVGVAENVVRTGAGRSVKDLTAEKQLMEKSRSSGKVPALFKEEDFEEDADKSTHSADEEYAPVVKKRGKLRRINGTRKTEAEDTEYKVDSAGGDRDSEIDDVVEDEDGALVPRQSFETVDDGDEFAYQKRYAEWVKMRRIKRFVKEEPSFKYDSDDEDSPISKDIFDEPTVPLENDLKLSEEFTVPGDVASKLFPYQLTTLSWLLELHNQQTGGILGDEMGLGKTIQIVAFLSGLHRSGMIGSQKPVLVVAPATVLRQWAKEFHEWWGALRVVILHSSGSGVGNLSGGGVRESSDSDIDSDDSEAPRSKKRNREGKGRASKSGHVKVHKKISELVNRVVTQGHVLLTTYEGVRVYKDVLVPVQWAYVVLDEGHKIRNADAGITLVAKRLKTPHRIILSGTPIQNNLKELWSLYDFVFPGRLGTLPVFLTQFEVPIRLGAYANASNLQVQTAQRCATVLRDLISPYLLRRLKCDVASDLPQKTESVLFCKLTQQQRYLYEKYIRSDVVVGAIDGSRNALKAIDGVRKICNHPDLLSRDLDSEKPDYGNPTRSGKMQVVKALLSMWKRQGHRALVFCQTRQMQEILQRFMADEGHKFFRMDGMTPIKNRIALVDQFNSDTSVTVFLLTTKVGGLGINLTGANRVLIFDPDWNPSTDVQARERAWRLGQTRDVAVYRLMMSGTIEEKIYHRQIYKQFMTNKILSDPGGGGHKRFFDSRSMKDLFILADEDSMGTETGDMFKGTEVVKKSDIDRQEKYARKSAHAPVGLTALGKGKTPVTHANEDGDADKLDEIDDIAKVEDFQAPVEKKEAAEDDTAANPTDAEDSRMLFSLLHSTVAHDKVMNSESNALDPLVRAEADRVAREAAEEVRLSRKRVRAEQKRASQAHGGTYMGVVTFTGNSGTAGRKVAARPSDGNRVGSTSDSRPVPNNAGGRSDVQSNTDGSLSNGAPKMRFGGGSSRGGLTSASLLDGLKKKFK